MVKKSMESNQLMSSKEQPMSNGGGQTSHSLNDINKLKQSGNNYTSEDIVVMQSLDNKNHTVRTAAGKNEKKDMLTALWKGQSTLATLTSNPLKSSMFRASTVQHTVAANDLNTHSEEQSTDGRGGLIAALPPDRSDSFKQQLNLIGLDPRRAIFAPKTRQLGGINQMNHAQMTVKQSEHQHLLIKARLNKLAKEKERAQKRINDQTNRAEFLKKIHAEKLARQQQKQELQMKQRLEEDKNRMKIREAKERSYIQINQAKSMVAQVNRDMQNEQKNKRRQHSLLIENFKSEVNLELKRNAVLANQRRQQSKDFQTIRKMNDYQGNRDYYSERIREQIDRANNIDNETRQLEQLEIQFLDELKQTQKLQLEKQLELAHLEKQSPYRSINGSAKNGRVFQENSSYLDRMSNNNNQFVK